MAWRIVKQPDGLYSRWADPVDDFTHVDMTFEEAMRLCIDSCGLKIAFNKMTNAEQNPGRYTEAIEMRKAVHGK